MSVGRMVSLIGPGFMWLGAADLTKFTTTKRLVNTRLGCPCLGLRKIGVFEL